MGQAFHLTAGCVEDTLLEVRPRMKKGRGRSTGGLQASRGERSGYLREHDGYLVWRKEVVGLGHWPFPHSSSMRVSMMLAYSSQSRNIIAKAARPDTFTCEALYLLLAPAAGGPSGCCIRLHSWASP